MYCGWFWAKQEQQQNVMHGSGGGGAPGFAILPATNPASYCQQGPAQQEQQPVQQYLYPQQEQVQLQHVGLSSNHPVGAGSLQANSTSAQQPAQGSNMAPIGITDHDYTDGGGISDDVTNYLSKFKDVIDHYEKRTSWTWEFNFRVNDLKYVDV